MPRAAPSQKVQSARLKKLTFGGLYAAKPGFTESRHRHTCGNIIIIIENYQHCNIAEKTVHKAEYTITNTRAKL